MVRWNFIPPLRLKLIRFVAIISSFACWNVCLILFCVMQITYRTSLIILELFNISSRMITQNRHWGILIHNNCKPYVYFNRFCRTINVIFTNFMFMFTTEPKNIHSGRSGFNAIFMVGQWSNYTTIEMSYQCSYSVWISWCRN